MRRATKRNAGCGAGDFGKAINDAPNNTATLRGEQRSPFNWFLDAACYALDGDVASARLSAMRGVAAMGGAQ